MAQKQYNTREVAKVINISDATLVRWIKSEFVKATLNASGSYFIKHEDLKEFISNPPNPRLRGIIALIDRDRIRELIGEEKPKKQYKWGGYRRKLKPIIGWALR
jgi:hypothetical protein